MAKRRERMCVQQDPIRQGTIFQSWALSVFFAFFYEDNNLCLHKSYLKSPLPVKLIKNAKNHFLLLKKFKNTSSAQLCNFRPQLFAGVHTFCQIHMSDISTLHIYYRSRLMANILSPVTHTHTHTHTHRHVRRQNERTMGAGRKTQRTAFLRGRGDSSIYRERHGIGEQVLRMAVVVVVFPMVFRWSLGGGLSYGLSVVFGC